MHIIHPGFLSYLERAQRGDKVIWQENMRLLHCFSHNFTGNHDQLIFSRYTGVYELGYDRYVSERGDPCAIVFYCAHAQLLKRPPVLQNLRKNDFSLPAIVLLEDAISILEENGNADPELEETHIEAKRFLMREDITIPWSELEFIMKSVQRH